MYSKNDSIYGVYLTLFKILEGKINVVKNNKL